MRRKELLTTLTLLSVIAGIQVLVRYKVRIVRHSPGPRGVEGGVSQPHGGPDRGPAFRLYDYEDYPGTRHNRTRFRTPKRLGPDDVYAKLEEAGEAEARRRAGAEEMRDARRVFWKLQYGGIKVERHIISDEDT